MPSSADPIRVLIADDHPLFREGVMAILNRMEEIRVVGEARSGDEAITLAADLRPDVVLMDLDMPDLDGLSAIRILTGRKPSPKILVLSAYEDDYHVYAAMKAGAVGYVLKRMNQAGLV